MLLLNMSSYHKMATTIEGRTPLIRAPIGFYGKVCVFKA